MKFLSFETQIEGFNSFKFWNFLTKDGFLFILRLLKIQFDAQGLLLKVL